MGLGSGEKTVGRHAPPAAPVAGAIARAVLLLVGGVHRRAAS